MPRFDHFRHHGRFYLSVLCGIAVGLLPLTSSGGVRISLAGAAFFLIYLASVALAARGLTTEDLRAKATFQDEGIALIVLITLAIIVLSLSSLALLVGTGWRLIPAIANVPFGWATLHTVMAFHYAHLFYARSDQVGREVRDAGGLEFPKTKEPSVSDFVYYSFTVGMTTQVSDVQATSRQMRNATLTHSIVSFFFNAVILALAVNVAAGLMHDR